MWRIIVAVAFAFGLTGTAAAEEFEVAGWYGDSYHDPATNEFKFCSLSAKYGNDRLSIAITLERKLVIVVARPTWSFQQGATLNFELKVDGQAVSPSRADATQPTEFRVIADYTEEVYNLLAAGSVLNLVSESETYAYDISKEAPAFKKLRECFEFGEIFMKMMEDPETAKYFIGPSESDTAAEVTGILRDTGLDERGFRYLPATERNGWFEDADMTWFDGQVYGALYAYVEASRPFAELIEEVQGMRREQCLGKFDIATVPTEPLPGGSPISVDRYFCELATGVIVSMSVITQSDEDSLLVVLHGAPYDSGEAVALAALQIQAHLRAVAMVKQN